MNDKVTTQDKNFDCLECQNEVKITDHFGTGDVVECEFCGIEYEITKRTDDITELQIIEEEK